MAVPLVNKTKWLAGDLHHFILCVYSAVLFNTIRPGPNLPNHIHVLPSRSNRYEVHREHMTAGEVLTVLIPNEELDLMRFARLLGNHLRGQPTTNLKAEVIFLRALSDIVGRADMRRRKPKKRYYQH